MLSVDMSSLWGCDDEQIVKGVLEAKEHIVSYRDLLNTSKKTFRELRKDIIAVCNFWVSNTYIGQPKADDVKKAFQSFFEELMALLLNMKKSNVEYERSIAAKLLYRGKVYRYLGNVSQSGNEVPPVFDGIYVSWSKNPENSYITNKLYGTIIRLSCKISEPLYGIDLDNLGCSRANEHEVVFPTIEKCITEIENIPE